MGNSPRNKWVQDPGWPWCFHGPSPLLYYLGAQRPPPFQKHCHGAVYQESPVVLGAGSLRPTEAASGGPPPLAWAETVKALSCSLCLSPGVCAFAAFQFVAA